MVADIIIIAVFALLFFIDFKRGIAITILNVAGVALTGFLAYHISNFLASWVYTAFVQQTLTTNLQQMIDTQGINSAIANSFSALPNWVMGMLGFFLSIFGLDSSVYTNDFQVPNSAAAAVGFGGKSYSAGYHRNVPLGYRCSYFNNYLYNYKNSC